MNALSTCTAEAFLPEMVFRKDNAEPLILEGVPQSQRLIIESHASAQLMLRENGISASSLSIRLMDEACLHLYILSEAQEGLESRLELTIDLQKNAHLFIHDINVSRGQSFCDMLVSLAGPGSSLSYGGLHLLNCSVFSSTNLLIKHEAEHTISNQAFRGIYAGSAKGSFAGTVVVATSAHNSDAQQLYKAIVLDEQATAQVRPHLEINNRHIKASHGASIGKLDEDALFYLRSRGLSEISARALLVKSLVGEVLDFMPDGALSNLARNQVEQAISRVIS